MWVAWRCSFRLLLSCNSVLWLGEVSRISSMMTESSGVSSNWIRQICANCTSNSSMGNGKGMTLVFACLFLVVGTIWLFGRAGKRILFSWQAQWSINRCSLSIFICNVHNCSVGAQSRQISAFVGCLLSKQQFQTLKRMSLADKALCSFVQIA